MSGVVITGAVPDTRYLRAATVYVVPLQVGGGTRFKILEAGAMGRAIVSTTLGAEGFPNVEQAVTLADDAAALRRNLHHPGAGPRRCDATPWDTGAGFRPRLRLGGPAPAAHRTVGECWTTLRKRLY